jgi:hypothetical protein
MPKIQKLIYYLTVPGVPQDIPIDGYMVTQLKGFYSKNLVCILREASSSRR